MKLEKYRDQIYSCLRCAFCFDQKEGEGQKICPPYATYGFESYGARGKLTIARALIDKEIEYDEDVAERIFACTECEACQEQCFKHLSLTEIYAAMKEDLAEQDLLPAGLSDVLAQVDEFGNPYKQSAERRLAWLSNKERVDQRADVLFFVGCTTAYLRRGIARSSYEVLDKLGIDFTILGNEKCCGHPYIVAGKMDQAKKVAATNLEAISRLGIKTVVFACPGCLRTFKEDMPRLLGKPLPFETIHLSEFFTDELAKNPVQLNRLSRVVTYHDPCILGRHMGIYEPPRELVEMIPGVRLLEMPRNRDNSFCCGNGAFVRYDYEEMSVKSELDRFTEAEATGADTVVSACPACQSGLLDAKSKTGSKVEVLDIIELLAKALRDE